ncbi:hypothetical protein L1887_42154 [Cichorium endivia]|nr:hypothetical protein L1887_42154 [Cichorium endivia]
MLDINECEDESNFPCYGVCTNTRGSYNCTCSPGYDGADGKTANGCRPVAKESKFPNVVIPLVMVFGFLAILSGVIGICFGIRKRNLIKLREKFFEQNGGVFLKQKIKAPGVSDVVTISGGMSWLSWENRLRVAAEAAAAFALPSFTS